jgi:hypothetical protein
VVEGFVSALGSNRVIPMEPWTRRIQLTFRPLVSFYEHKPRILRELEDAGLVRQFTTADDSVVVRLRDPEHILVFGARKIIAGGLSPETDVEMLKKAVEAVWNAMQPSPGKSVQLEFQWLIPMSQGYDEARIAAGKSVLELPADTKWVDFAMVIDGAATDFDGSFKGSAGIVESAEVPPRLSKVFGYVEGKPMPPALWKVEALPDVAVYCSQRWTVREDIDSVDSMFALWQRVQARSATIAEMFNARLFQKGTQV